MKNNDKQKYNIRVQSHITMPAYKTTHQLIYVTEYKGKNKISKDPLLIYNVSKKKWYTPGGIIRWDTDNAILDPAYQRVYSMDKAMRISDKTIFKLLISAARAQHTDIYVRL